MATYENIQTKTGIVGSALTVYRLVSLAADGQFDHTAADAEPHGVCAETIATVGAAFPYALPNQGTVKVVASAAIAVGAKLAAATGGKVVTNANPGIGNFWVGTALSAAGADGDVIEMQFTVDLDQVA